VEGEQTFEWELGNDDLAGAELARLLARGIHPLRLKIEQPLVQEIEAELRSVLAASTAPLAASCARLSAWVEARLARIAQLHGINEDFSARLGRAPDEAARRMHILDYARALGADARQLKGDARAFNRWFGYDAVAERYRKRVAQAEREATFGLGRLGVLAAEGTKRTPSRTAWRRLGIEAAALRALDHAGDARVRTAAWSCLRAALEPLDEAIREELLGEELLVRLNRAAIRRGPDVATQMEALELLRMVAPEAFRRALRERLLEHGPGDDFWVRRHAVALLFDAQDIRQELEELIGRIRQDPSPAARQALAMHIHRAPPEIILAALPAIVDNDPAPEVRAAALASLPALLGRVGHVTLAPILSRTFRMERDSFVLRVALKAAADAAQLLPRAARQDWVATIRPEIERLHLEAAALPVRRWAAEARERIWCATDPDAADLAAYLRARVAGIREGRAVRVKGLKERLRSRPDIVLRVLAVLAQSDFSYDLSRGGFGLSPRLRRGDRFAFRLWRAWHELRHASPDKRQAFSHTSGRVYPGEWHAPSAIMAELAETKVPGEPLFISGEGGWRPYLPLPDHALSAIDTGRSVRLVTSEGMTEMTPPRGFLRRIRSRLALSLRFAEIAALRNWTEKSSGPPSGYIKALEELGFTFALRPHEDGSAVDPMVARFFGLGVLPLLLPPDLWRRAEAHFFSVYQNTLTHLAVFIVATIAWFVGRHVWVNQRIRRMRRALPLVLGGWGTRGKSGTERIKAGVINALGYSLVSKTTGNEAMFLYGYPFGPVKEMFLFRPYDKATIWEQADIARLATRLKGDVFLWECMGLTPSYVKVLQRHWMRDDISTITNTYPDHEDLQGPAGRNIPEVMTNFIPEGGHLLTSEEQMRPILAEAARELGTTVEGVGWLEAGLLPSDALRRFPYEEHPFNIALVLKMAEAIGVERDFALREMADRVVPDLGVLKAYPVAMIGARRLEFVMGMSANERFGALGNWTRMGFDKQDPYAEPGVFITAVVNNRADRVPRSRVFADLLVSDVSLDRIVLIGSNLEGLQGYIEEAWTARAPGLTLWPTGGQEAGDPAVVLEAAARRMRVAYREEHVVAGLRAMLEGIQRPIDVDGLLARWNDPGGLKATLAEAGVVQADDLLEHLESMRRTLSEYAGLEARLGQGKDRAEIDKAFRETLRDWLRRKIVVVEDYYATGDQIIDVLRQATPPGYFGRVIGMQNIKGTGLDFVYRWQAWDTVHSACEMAESDDPQVAAAGLQTLLSFQEYGIAAEERVRVTIAQLREREGASEMLQAQLDLVVQALDAQLAQVRQEMGVTRAEGPMSNMIEAAEAFLDAGDAVGRRRVTERIYRDMVTERISHERAARELKKLNSRQKGGWLSEDLAGYREAVRRLWRRTAGRRP
jgi:gamma-polyglutamate synthase